MVPAANQVELHPFFIQADVREAGTRPAIPKSVRPHRIPENINIFDFALTPDEVAAIDALDTGVRGGPDPEILDTELFTAKIDTPSSASDRHRRSGQAGQVGCNGE